jgi:hypothetical protein
LFLQKKKNLYVQVHHHILAVTEEALKGELKFTAEYTPKLTPIISMYFPQNLVLR